MGDELTAKRKKPYMLIGIALVFLAPIVLAYLWKPTEFKNRGELIEPVRVLKPFVFVTPDRQNVGLELLQGKWSMITFADSNCDDACIDKLVQMRQSGLSQGKNAHRVQSILVIPDHYSDKPLATFQDKFPNLKILIGAQSELETFTQQFYSKSEADALTGEIFLIDPLGNLMMQYDSDDEIDAIAKDLRRLLRVSRIG